MAEIVKETVVTQDTTSTVPATNTLAYLIYFICGVIEILLAFRLVFKLTGANPVSPFVSLIYGLSNIFVWPFQGIFRSGYTQGVETTAILEPAILVAMAVYAVLAWGIIKLVAILAGKRPSSV